MSNRARGAARPDEQAPLIAYGVGAALLDQTTDKTITVHVRANQAALVEADDVAASYRSSGCREMRA